MLVLVLLFGAHSSVYAWGGRAHGDICEVAVHLVRTPELREFLRARINVMSHLCDLPDSYWKGLGPEVREIGRATHFIDPEVLGLKVKDIPLDLSEVVAKFTGKPSAFDFGKNIKSVHDDVGTLWWRVDEFMRKIKDLKTPLASAPLPTNRGEETREDFSFNANVHQYVVYMGLLGHFVADATMPFHNSADYDGYRAGHGGIHNFYEIDLVSEFGADFQTKIKKVADQLAKRHWKKQANSDLELIRSISQEAIEEIPAVLKIDKLVRPSRIEMKEGKEIRIPAERESARRAFPRFEKLILIHLAKASLNLAMFWERGYTSLGSPKTLGKYKNWKYPIVVDFVVPDYLPSAKTPISK